MSHPRELIDRIASHLAVEYPRDLFHYVFESALRGTRMQPDIQITQGGVPVCVVEIGYTRPEKLTAYRQHYRIPDVRWYDKTGRLHADVEARVIQVAVTLAPPAVVYLYETVAQVPCIACPDLYADSGLRRIPDTRYDRYVRRYGLDAADDREEATSNAEYEETSTLVVTDYLKAWLPTVCDRCGRSWFADLQDDAELIAWALDDEPREIAKQFGARRAAPWLEIVTEVESHYGGLRLRPEDGQFLDRQDERWVQHEVHAQVAVVRAR
jgi:hypothetical protein